MLAAVGVNGVMAAAAIGISSAWLYRSCENGNIMANGNSANNSARNGGVSWRGWRRSA
jgi:ribose 5-phosphate isomerase RpiB